MTTETPKLRLKGLPPRMVGAHLVSAVTVMLGDEVVKTVVVRLDDEEMLTTLADDLANRFNGATDGREDLLTRFRALATPDDGDGDEPSREQYGRTTQIIELVTARTELFHSIGHGTYAR